MTRILNLKTRTEKVLLNDSPSNILLIGDSLILNISWYQDVWSEYFSKHNTFNFGILGDKIQNLLWRIKNLKFPSNSTLFYIFILYIFIEVIMWIINPVGKS